MCYFLGSASAIVTFVCVLCTLHTQSYNQYATSHSTAADIRKCSEGGGKAMLVIGFAMYFYLLWQYSRVNVAATPALKVTAWLSAAAGVGGAIECSCDVHLCCS
jgi:hypothetical protein